MELAGSFRSRQHRLAASCSYRFTKCTEIGMEKSWVMTEDERMQQLKLRQEKKRQKEEEEKRRRMAQEHRLQPHVPLLEEQHLYLSGDDLQEIEQLFSTFYKMYEKCPMLPNGIDNPDEQGNRMVTIFVNSIIRMVSFVGELPRFRQLTPSDQKVLLQNGLLAIIILRGTMNYDGGTHFTLKERPDETRPPTVSIGEIRTLMKDDLYKSHQKFYTEITELGLDEKTLMLLQMVVLYSHDKNGLVETEKVNGFQASESCSTYMRRRGSRTTTRILIRRYMSWHYGKENTRILFPRMLHSLTNLRELTEAHNMRTIHFTTPDIDKLKAAVREININPYPNCPEILATAQYGEHVRHGSEPGASYPDPMSSWPEEQRQARQGSSRATTSVAPPQHEYPDDLNSFLDLLLAGLDKPGTQMTKRFKSETPSPLGSPLSSPGLQAARAHPSAAFPAAASHQQQPQQPQQQPQQQQQQQPLLTPPQAFSPFCSQNSYERSRPTLYTDAAGFHGNYSTQH
ncbi:Thyroid hormone receptor alpha-A [Amphibalanus amphitrite]|uniref:Thyroid hormone receptor alpha-A n=1 Tax=Amphibalanus amphitrite TaxID=1232801 RepID=A0A6A4VRZ1_AMPAM|nr:Thyroid hormone receptor alpha-A [Amphibalanus amphitrite]